MMISIVTIFLICHSIEAIFIVIDKSVDNETKIVKGYLYAILVNFSAGINTLIYCIFNRKFKKKFLKLVTLECFKNSSVYDESSHFQMNPLRTRHSGPENSKKSSQKNSSNQKNIPWNYIFGSFKLFPSSKIDFWPFLTLQKMEFRQKNLFIWFHVYFWPGFF